jgi:hypothetical protein
VAGHLGAIHHHIGDFALISIIEKLGKADVLFLAGACALDDKLPRKDGQVIMKTQIRICLTVEFKAYSSFPCLRRRKSVDGLSDPAPFCT